MALQPKSIVFLIVGLVLVATSIGLGAFYFLNDKNKDEPKAAAVEKPATATPAASSSENLVVETVSLPQTGTSQVGLEAKEEKKEGEEKEEKQETAEEEPKDEKEPEKGKGDKKSKKEKGKKKSAKPRKGETSPAKEGEKQAENQDGVKKEPIPAETVELYPFYLRTVDIDGNYFDLKKVDDALALQRPHQNSTMWIKREHGLCAFNGHDPEDKYDSKALSIFQDILGFRHLRPPNPIIFGKLEALPGPNEKGELRLKFGSDDSGSKYLAWDNGSKQLVVTELQEQAIVFTAVKAPQTLVQNLLKPMKFTLKAFRQYKDMLTREPLFDVIQERSLNPDAPLNPNCMWYKINGGLRPAWAPTQFLTADPTTKVLRLDHSLFHSTPIPFNVQAVGDGHFFAFTSQNQLEQGLKSSLAYDLSTCQLKLEHTPAVTEVQACFQLSELSALTTQELDDLKRLKVI